MSPLTKTLVVLNSLGAIASLAPLVFTWQAESIIVEKAATIALEQTRAQSEPTFSSPFASPPKFRRKSGAPKAPGNAEPQLGARTKCATATPREPAELGFSVPGD